MVTSGNVASSLSLSASDLPTNIILNAGGDYDASFPVTLVGTITVHSNDVDGFELEFDGGTDSDNSSGQASFLREGITGASADTPGEYAKIKVSLTQTARTYKGASPDKNDMGTFYEVGASRSWSYLLPTQATLDLDYDIKIDVEPQEYQSLLVDIGGSVYSCTLNLTLSDY